MGWKPGAVPVLVAAERTIADWLKPVPEKPGCFRSDGVGRPRDVEFVPFYRLPRRTYALYGDLFTPQEWETKAPDIAAEEERPAKPAHATVASAQHPIPTSVVEAKKKITIRFQATHGNEIAAVFGLRLIRADAEP